jgi:hypothetical protein
MRKPLDLPFDPIDRAGDIWEGTFGPASSMRVATSIMRVQQILLACYDDILRGYGLTFARYEALVLLRFSRRGALPLKVMGSRLMVHPTSVTNTVDRLAAAIVGIRPQHRRAGHQGPDERRFRTWRAGRVRAQAGLRRAAHDPGRSRRLPRVAARLISGGGRAAGSLAPFTRSS